MNGGENAYFRRMLLSFHQLVVASAFALVVVPRMWLHRCDQEHTDHDHPDHAALYADLDCEVCSVLVTVFDGRCWRCEAGPGLAREFHFRAPIVATVERWMEKTASRGPPQA
jgi:hypothetical protein